jgi:hypothetical protein
MRLVLFAPNMSISRDTAGMLESLRFKHEHNVSDAPQDGSLQGSLASTPSIINVSYCIEDSGYADLYQQTQDITEAMQSMQTCPHVGTNVQKLLQAVGMDNERQLMSDGGSSAAEQALVYRAIRDAIDRWKSTSPEITKSTATCRETLAKKSRRS